MNPSNLFMQPSKNNPFNYPFPQRPDSMYLSVVDSSHKQPQHHTSRVSRNMEVDDIEGTRPKMPGYFIRNTSTSKQEIIKPSQNWKKAKMNIRSDSLKIDDIEGTSTKAKHFYTSTKRNTNPLTPVYKLPTFEALAQPTVSKFIKCSLQTSDINTKKKSYFRSKTEETPLLQDSQPVKLKLPIKDKQSDKFNVKDINRDRIFTSRRITDNLNPKYQWKDSQENPCNPAYSGPLNIHYKRITVGVNKVQDYNLRVADIPGAHSNSFYERAFFLEKRRHGKDPLKTEDIEKAGANSLQRGIVTQRKTNPLAPAYKYLGSKELAIKDT